VPLPAAAQATPAGLDQIQIYRRLGVPEPDDLTAMLSTLTR
jgi:hypothetical protein